MRKASKLTNSERSEIDILHSKGYSARSIARALGRSPNTIASELKLNSYEDGRYVSARAKHKAYCRRKYARYQGKKIQENNDLRSFIIQCLKDEWNPDVIAGYLKDNPSLGFYASKTAIYEWLRSSWGQQHCTLLYSKSYRRKPRAKNKTERSMISGRISITERPESVQDRQEIGHWEYDSIVSSKRSHSTYALAVVYERSSRFLMASLVPNLKPEPYARTIIQLVNGFKTKTMTTDNGIENKQHQIITEKTGATVFFTDPYSSWQKGGVENGNKLIRQSFPKGTDFATVSETDVVNTLWRINNKPRKILGYKSPLTIAKMKGLILDESVLIRG
jgi:transposase, IS30 family